MLVDELEGEVADNPEEAREVGPEAVQHRDAAEHIVVVLGDELCGL
jgi:hypothetical protein